MINLLENSDLMINEAEYPIILYETDTDTDTDTDTNLVLGGSKAVHIHEYSELEEVVNLARSLGISFLLIMRHYFDGFISFLEALKEDFYFRRRLADFEEEGILKEVLDESGQRSCTIYLFITREDFEGEVFEGDLMNGDGAKGFQEEFVFWERRQRGWEDEDASFKKPQGSDDLCQEEQDYIGCKEFCLSNLKGLASMKSHEKKKLVYYVNLGQCCYELGEYQKAFEYFIQSFDIIKFMYGETHASLAYLASRLAELYKDLCESNDKIPLLELKRPLGDYLKPEDSEKLLETANSYENLALTCNEAKEYNKALDFCLKALEIRKNISGEMHRELMGLYWNIAQTYCNLEEYVKAAENLLKAIKVESKTFGEEGHDKIANGYKNIAICCEKGSDNEAAIEFYSRALELKESIYGQPHVDIAELCQSLADLYHQCRDFDQAKVFHVKALSVKEAIYGELHSETALSLFKIGSLCFQLGNCNEALENLLKALKIYRVTCGENDEATAYSYYGAGATFTRLRDYRRAVKYLLKARDIYDWILRNNACEEDVSDLKARLGDLNRHLIHCQQRIDCFREVEGVLCG